MVSPSSFNLHFYDDNIISSIFPYLHTKYSKIFLSEMFIVFLFDDFLKMGYLYNLGVAMIRHRKIVSYMFWKDLKIYESLISLSYHHLCAGVYVLCVARVGAGWGC